MNRDPEQSTISRVFHRFEAIITVGIVVLISVMILAAFWGLLVETYNLVLHGAFNTFEHKTFQAAFGMVMTLLIAIEFNRTIMQAYLEKGREVIVKTVVLVSMLAVSRQFIVFELNTTSPLTLAALAIALLSLGVVYWLIGRAVPPNDKEQ